MARESIASALRQWPGVHRPEVAEVAGEPRDGNAVHRTGKSLGKRLLREFQWEATGECLNGEIIYSLKEAQSSLRTWLGLAANPGRWN